MTQPAYIKNLKAYARRQFGDEEESMAIVASLTDESDRGAVILAATSIEDVLEFRIGMMMKNLEPDVAARSEIFGANGCVSTFSSKTLVAYALGIIDKETRKEIDIVREIRNACAHSRLPLSFNAKELQDAAKVVIGEEFLSYLTSQEPKVLRQAFVIQCSRLAQRVGTGKRETIGESLNRVMEDRADRSSPNPSP